MARRIKSDYNDKGHAHREHRSKKNRKSRSGFDWDRAKDRKRHLEMLKLKDLEG